MGLTRVLNDDLASAVGKPSGSEQVGMGITGSRTLGPNASVSTSQPYPIKVFFDELGFVAEIGRGETDSARTYVALKNHSGTTIYIFPNDAGNALTVQSTKP